MKILTSVCGVQISASDSKTTNSRLLMLEIHSVAFILHPSGWLLKKLQNFLFSLFLQMIPGDGGQGYGGDL